MTKNRKSALKNGVDRRSRFARCDVGDVLDLYYGVFKPSGAYVDWKDRLSKRRVHDKLMNQAPDAVVS